MAISPSRYSNADWSSAKKVGKHLRVLFIELLLSRQNIIVSCKPVQKHAHSVKPGHKFIADIAINLCKNTKTTKRDEY